MKEQNQDGTEIIIYHYPENQVETIELNGKIEEITGYRNNEIVFKMHNGIITYGNIEDVEYIIENTVMSKKQLEIFKRVRGL